MKSRPLILILMFLLLWNSCSTEDSCDIEDLISRVNTSFKVRDELGIRDTTLNAVSFYAVTRPDSMILDNANGISSVTFPLPHWTQEYSEFALVIDSLSDTITIWHTPSPTLVSFECGFTTVHSIYWVAFDTSLIDTIAIQNPHVDLNEEENLRIYIKQPPADTTGR